MSLPDKALRRGLLVTGIAVLISTALTPSAGADAPTVGIGLARTVDLQRGLFTVPVWTDAAGATITSVTATVVDAGSSVVTLDLSKGDGGRWTPSSPLELVEDGGVMPHLGAYPLDITATDDQGNTVTRAADGPLNFTLRPEFAPVEGAADLALTRPTLTLGHDDTAVRGRLVGVQPGSADIVPLDGAAVAVTRTVPDYVDGRPADSTVTATTDSAGNFTTTTFQQNWPAFYQAQYVAPAAGTTSGSANSTAVSPDIQTTHVVITGAKIDRATVAPGTRVTISGTARRNSASGPPLAGVPVALYQSGYGNEPVRIVSTDGKGRFTGTFTAVADSYGQDSWSAVAQGTFVDGDGASGRLTVADEAAYSGVAISLAANGVVTAHATLGRVYVPDRAVYAGQLTRLEWSLDGRTGWHVITSVRVTYGPITITGPSRIDVYYRLEHPMSNELATATTTPVRLHRTVTRFTELRATPASVAAGHPITVTGLLSEYRSPAWHPMGRRHVELFFLATGARTYTYVTSGSTAPNGRVAIKAKPTKTGRWLLQYYGDATHFNTFDAPVPVTVR